MRYVNYHITETGKYINCENHIITSNKYLKLDNQFNILQEKMFDLGFNGRRYIGVEDVRIFRDIETKQIIFTGTGYHENEQIGIVKGDYDIEKKHLIVNELKSSFSNSYCEKNWVFVDYKNSTHMIYSWNPLKICKLDENTNLLHLMETKNMPKIFSHVRGSSCGFKYNRIMKGIIENLEIVIEKFEIWFVLHLVSYECPRYYYHMIAVFDENMNLIRYSAPFKFEDDCIEYCLSIVVEDERVIMNYSVWDRTTKIAVYDKKYIETILKY